MARPSLSDIRGVSGNLITQNDFVIVIGVVPGSGYSASRDVQLKCVSLSLPKIEIEPLEVSIRGFKTMHRGIRRLSDNTFSCEFYVSGGGGLIPQNGDSYQLIYNWLQFLCDSKTGSSQPGKKKFFSAATGNAAFDNNTWLNSKNPNVINNTKSAYAIDDVVINVYNTSGNLSLRYTLTGVFPLSLEGLDFENNTTEKQLLKVRATFALDNMELSDILTTKSLDVANKGLDKLTTAIPAPLRNFAKKLSNLL